MFRSRVPRSAVAAALSISLIAAFMVGTTSAASSQQASDRAAPAAPKPKPSPTPTPTPVPTPTPTPSPTPNSDNRAVYFGDLHSYPDGDGLLVPSIVTAGNTFAIDIFVENEGNQRLTHSEVGYGNQTVARSDTDDPSLPEGSTIVSATLNGVACAIVTADGALCDLGQFDAGETANIQFVVNAPSSPGATATWASFKVAENVPDQGANRNTFYADASFVVGPTNSNSNATYKLGNGAFSFSTSGQTLVKKDSMTTTVSVPGDTGAGAISISEEDCDASCVGQIATVHVRNGDDQTPYLEWKLVITGSIDGVITHELDELDAEGNPIEVVISESCVGDADGFDCIVSNVKNGNVTTIIFRTETNGRVKAG